MELPEPDWYIDRVLVAAGPLGGPGITAVGNPALEWQQSWAAMADEVADGAGELAATQGFVLTTRQLRDLGWSRQQVRTAVANGRWYAPARGVVSPFDVRGDGHEPRRRREAVRATAHCLSRPGTVVGGRSAAILSGLPTLELPGLVELTTLGPDTHGRRDRVNVRKADVPADAASMWFGAPVTSAARTLVDLGRHDRRAALVAADAALRDEVVRPAALARAIDSATGWFGVRNAREVLALVDARAESPLESLARLAMHDSKFPQPQLQVEIGGYRVDFLLPNRLIVEADGRGKYTGAELWREKRREHELRRLGYWVERVIWADVVYDWPASARRLLSAMYR